MVSPTYDYLFDGLLMHKHKITDIAGLVPPFIFKGAIDIASEFPTLSTVQNGWTYTITSDVTDNDATKTNTGQSFLKGDEITWNGTDWTILGNELLWTRVGTTLSPVNVGDIISTTGSVGVGTITPTAKLDVTGGNLHWEYLGSGTASVDFGRAAQNSGVSITFANSAGKAGGLIAGTVGSGFAYDHSGTFNIIGEDRADIDNDNIGTGPIAMSFANEAGTHNVAMGTGAPVAYSKLLVYGAESPITTASSTARNWMNIQSDGTANKWAVGHNILNGLGAYQIYDYSSNLVPFKIMPNSVSDTLVLKEGKVGIGTTTPSSLFEVNRLFKSEGSNLQIGQNAEATRSGTNNTALGYRVMFNMPSGSTSSYNTAVGGYAMRWMSSGNYNTALGQGACSGATYITGSENTAVGANALSSIGAGNGNLAFGRSSLYYNSDGSYNTAIGGFSLNHISNGDDSTAIGYYADYYAPVAPRGTASTGTELEIGHYYYKVSFILDGVETAHSQYRDTGTSAGNQNMDLYNIPVYDGPLNCTARRVYRNTVGYEQIYYLVTEISDNIATTFTDGISDAILQTKSLAVDPEGSIIIGSRAKSIFSNEFILGSTESPITNAFLGEGVYTEDPQGIALHASGGKGTDNVGGDFIIAAGRGTGTALGGSILFQTTATGTTGALANPLVTSMALNSSGNVGIGTATPTSTLEVNGSRADKTDVIATPTTLGITHNIVIVSNGSTITLPTAASITGRQYNIIRSGTSDVLISTNGAETISGDSELNLTSQWDSVVMVSDGTNWVRCS